MKRRYSRGRGGGRIALAPVAFIGTEDVHSIEQRDRMRRHTAALNHSARTLAATEELERLVRQASTEPMSVEFRGVDSLGRRNPRVRPTRFGRV